MKDAEVHHVPAKISLDGPAPVSTYFLPAAAETDDKPAAGKSATTGTAEDSDSSDDEAHDCGGGGGGIDDDGPWDAALQVDATFSSLSVWRHDRVPSSGELHQRLARLTGLMGAVHAQA
ncbi:hypothetical protein FNF29_06704 [Cafeteria roenbergensis]|uniref:Uncharacterized protein n=1 Tax=Cafeteria roenbergensis TaxID=33653 RepID=A0A5A8C6L2_CAFRO|nr:hypothetical protein FNF29_06704 [Cafeteria roenbergensis]|eukprot:KAA0148317.1 hypothetical protein FNF29_06704 [Cafeteria roenbergensis]